MPTTDYSAEEQKNGTSPANSSQGLLSKIRLLPGDLVQVQTLNGSNSERYQVSIIGVHTPHSVLVTLPVVAGKLVFMKEGKHLLVRGFVGKDAVAYRTQVLKSLLSPYPYMHLSYPESVQSMRIRKTARVPVDMVAAIVADKTEMAARITDLSCGGARLTSKVVIGAEGDEIIVKFKINSGEQDIYLNVKSVIRNSTLDESASGSYVTGIQFVNLENQYRLYLENLVYQQMLDDND
jgi:c-di-GMP-binding flagellar brake protein YcgR